jgi:spermidine/putrescine-binding protein
MRHLNVLMRFFLILTCSISLAWSEELRILCWEGYATDQHTKKFKQYIKQKFQIDLEVSVTNVSDPQEFFDGIRGKEFDLISPAHNIPKSAHWTFIEQKLVLPINLRNVPNYQHIIPALKKADYITKDGLVYGVPIVYGHYGLAYNTEIIKQEPKSWDIFWDPKYAGQYAISADYHEANIYITALAMGYGKSDIFEFSALRDNKEFKQRLAMLASNAKSYWVGVDKEEDLKDLALATAWGFSFSELNKEGEKWKFASPKEGVTGWIDNWLIGYSLQNQPILKRIAEEWINYSIGPDMQVAYVRDIRQFPVNLTIKKLLPEEDVEKFGLTNLNYFQENFIPWKILSIDDQYGFKSLWAHAKQ